MSRNIPFIPYSYRRDAPLPHCCRVAAKGPNEAMTISCLMRVLPANLEKKKVEPRGFEPLTSAVQRRRSPN